MMHRSYFVQEHGKPPDVVVEIVSNRRGCEDSNKLEGYARIRVPSCNADRVEFPVGP